MPNKSLPISQQVNKVGKFIYKHIDGAYKIQFSANTCDVYIKIYYQIPGDLVVRYKLDESELNEMSIDISITQYQDKIRVNVIRMDELEATLGFFTISTKEIDSVEALCYQIYQEVCKKVEKAYEDYDFVF